MRESDATSKNIPAAVPQSQPYCKVIKFLLSMAECVYLGHLVGRKVVLPELSKVEEIQDFGLPCNLEETSKSISKIQWLL